jgi:hypothetical protein
MVYTEFVIDYLTHWAKIGDKKYFNIALKQLPTYEQFYSKYNDENHYLVYFITKDKIRLELTCHKPKMNKNIIGYKTCKYNFFTYHSESTLILNNKVILSGKDITDGWYNLNNYEL